MNGIDGSGVVEDMGLESNWVGGSAWLGCGRARNRENVTVRMESLGRPCQARAAITT